MDVYRHPSSRRCGLDVVAGRGDAGGVPAPRPPLWKQPLTLLMVALTVAGLVLLVVGPRILGVGLVAVGMLVNAVGLVRLRIRDMDHDLRARKRS